MYILAVNQNQAQRAKQNETKTMKTTLMTS